MGALTAKTMRLDIEVGSYLNKMSVDFNNNLWYLL